MGIRNFRESDYSERQLRTRIGLVTVVSYELLCAKIREYQWKIDHGTPCLSPEQCEMYQYEIDRLTPLLERLKQVI